MTNSEILDLFFSQRYENELNEMMMNDRFFVIPGEGILNYMRCILSVPYAEYLSYISKNDFSKFITSHNLTQSSSFKACELDMVCALINDGNRGLTFIEVGKLFPDKVKTHNDISWRKYGENQIKTAKQLGLTFEYFDHWYLNCVCYIYKELNIEEREGFMARALLRDPLYSTIMKDIQSANVDLVDYMGCLGSFQTKYRRYDSINRLTQICIDVCIREGVKIHKVSDTKALLKYIIKEENIKKKFCSKIVSINQDDNVTFSEDREVVAASSPFTLDYYKGKFSDLHCYRKNGKPAPHKALLLLSIMKNIEKGIITSNEIDVTPTLISEFQHLSETLNFDRGIFSPTIDNPYIHLAGDGFWKIVPKSLYADSCVIKRVSQIKYAIIDKELYEYMTEESSRMILQNVLLDKYFE